jgi:hypothetical protein
MLFVISRKHYLVGAWHPSEYRYLGPYKSKRYHLQDFRCCGQSINQKEVFNCTHSLLQNMIEYSFRVWK